jgi:hypothetical protein
MTTPPIIPGGRAPTPTHHPSPPPPRRRLSGGAALALIALGVVVWALILAAYLVWAASSTPAPSTPSGAAVSVKVQQCSAESGFYRATIRVTNNTTRTKSAVIDIEWTDAAGTRLATDTEYIRGLAPGQATVEEAVSAGVAGTSSVRCAVRLR